MNKKERNKKIVKKTIRNRIINKRYTSTIKTLSKLFILKKEECNKNKVEKPEEKEKNKIEISTLLKSLYSIIDKAVKKGVIHKNTAARKKSRVGKMYFEIQS
jgi:small subunit ribosomal protein S20